MTGGIGSGKSEFCRLLSRISGCAVYMADDKVKQLYESHPALLSDIEDALHLSLRDDEGRFCPVSLAGVIFSDAGAMEKVESLVFPALMEDFNSWKAGYSDDAFVIFESATVLEKEAFRGFGDFVVAVDAPFEIRLRRACARDGADEETILKRMEKQALMNALSERKHQVHIDRIVENDGSLEELKKKAEELLHDIA